MTTGRHDRDPPGRTARSDPDPAGLVLDLGDLGIGSWFESVSPEQHVQLGGVDDVGP